MEHFAFRLCMEFTKHLKAPPVITKSVVKHEIESFEHVACADVVPPTNQDRGQEISAPQADTALSRLTSGLPHISQNNYKVKLHAS